MSELATQLRVEIEKQTEQGGFARLLEVGKRALLAARKSHDHEAEALALYSMAQAYRYQGNHYEARVLNEEGVSRLAHEHQLNYIHVDALIQRAQLVLKGSFQYYEAGTDYQEALTVAHELRYGWGVAAGLVGMAEVLQLLEQYPQARNYAHEGLAFARELQLVNWQIRALHVIGTIFQQERKADLALKTLNHALTLSREQGFTLLETESLYALGIAYHQTDAAQALDYLTQAQQQAQQGGSLEQEFFIWSALGDTYSQQADYTNAQAAYKNLWRLASDTRNRLYDAFGYLQNGKLAQLGRDYATAAEHFQQSLAITREKSNPSLEATTLECLAQNSALQEDYEAAIDYYGQARNVYLALEDDAKVRRVMLRMVLMYFLGALQRVLRFLRLKE
jgi:tetratricopeptide (TPR) repeat protein